MRFLTVFWDPGYEVSDSVLGPWLWDPGYGTLDMGIGTWIWDPGMGYTMGWALAIPDRPTPGIPLHYPGYTPPYRHPSTHAAVVPGWPCSTLSPFCQN